MFSYEQFSNVLFRVGFPWGMRLHPELGAANSANRQTGEWLNTWLRTRFGHTACPSI
jgi:hypothetical protein